MKKKIILAINLKNIVYINAYTAMSTVRYNLFFQFKYMRDASNIKFIRY